MPGRSVPLISGEIYHVFNRGIDHGITFSAEIDFQRAVQALFFYQHSKLTIRLSRFLEYLPSKRAEFLSSVALGGHLVKVLCFCLMPNHFHLLVRQEADGGISKFLGNFLNSYTRFFNTIHRRDGSLFLDQFKAVRIETAEQLIHVSRYIHLNPLSGGVVKNLNDLFTYPWSSLGNYLDGAEGGVVDTGQVLSFFSNREKYRQFVIDNADHQRQLSQIKHLLFE